VFALFEKKGFERYTLSTMSVAQQIALFQNAEIIVGALGSGLANVIFCNPTVRIVDIFQARRDCTIYYLCQTLGLSYQCVKTMEFIDDYDGQFDTIVPLDIMENLVRSL
jgi:capsular polysaccharide biosynthesis protein